MPFNVVAVLVATLAGFVIGGLWYGPLFGAAWQRHAGVTPETLAARNMGVVFGVSFLLLLVAAVNLAMFIGPDQPLSFGLMAGAAAGIGWVATAFGVVYLFEARPFGHWLVNAGYFAVTLAVMGGILTAWPS
jgi:hypothetical protein